MLCLCQTTDMQAQTSPSVKLDISLTDSPLMELIKTIEARTDYTFLINTSINPGQHVTVDVRQASIPEILDIALKGKPVDYESERLMFYDFLYL